LLDPCNPPDSVSAPGLENQVYTISDAFATPYTHSQFTVVPDVCELRYVYSETKFIDNDGLEANAISRTDETFSFFYDDDLSPVKPVAQTQTVTIRAIGYSKYGEDLTAEESESWDLTFVNPCSKAGFTTINAVVQSDPVPDTDSYSGTQSVFKYSSYTTDPNLCELETSCERVSPVNSRFPCVEIDPNDNTARRTFTQEDYENGLEPGTYTTTYKVCLKDAPTVCEEFT